MTNAFPTEARGRNPKGQSLWSLLLCAAALALLPACGKLALDIPDETTKPSSEISSDTLRGSDAPSSGASSSRDSSSGVSSSRDTNSGDTNSGDPSSGVSSSRDSSSGVSGSGVSSSGVSGSGVSGSGVSGSGSSGSGVSGSGSASLAPCADQGAPCEDASQSNDEFLCAEAEGICLLRCTMDELNDTGNTPCPSKSWCSAIEDDGAINPALITDGDGVCLPRTCESTIFDHEACGADETCVPRGIDASFCVAAGNAVVGEACPSQDLLTGDCAPGLLCLNGYCVEPCDLGDINYCGEEVCLDVFDPALVAGGLAPPPGACRRECDPFTRGTCPDGGVCKLSIVPNGEMYFLCSAAPEAPLPAGADCSPLDEGLPDQACEEGYVCIAAVRSGEVGRFCTQLCDASGASSQPGSLCMVASEGGDICVPLSIGAGACAPACDPFPRRGDGNYGCPDDVPSCIPLMTPNGLRGRCVSFESPEIDAYADCPPEENARYGGCKDSAICLDFGVFNNPNFDEGSAAPYCASLCEPFTGSCEVSGVKCAFAYSAQEAFCTLDALFDLPEGQPCNPDAGEPADQYNYAVCGDNRRCFAPDPGSVPLCTQFCSENSHCSSGICMIPFFVDIYDFGLCA